LVKTDAYGTMLWDKTYGGTGNDYASSVVQTNDGGYLIAGTTNSFGSGNYDMYLVKTDPAGNIEASAAFGGVNDDRGSAAIETSDGGYAITGYTTSFGAGEADAFFVKTDYAGSMQWQMTYGGPDSEYGYSVVATIDGGYAIAGDKIVYGEAGDSDVLLVKTDYLGSMQWQMTYNGSDTDYGRSLVEASDGGYAIAGYTTSYGAGQTDVWLIKADSVGKALWNQTWGGPDFDFGYSVLETSDGGYAIAGQLRGGGGHDGWLIKTDVGSGLAWMNFTSTSITLCRGLNDIYWNYVRVRIWKID
jgi:hypothetical protein